MAKRHKIKRYDSMFRSSRERRRRWMGWLGGLLAVVVLFGIGWMIYEPVYEYIVGLDEQQEPQEDPQPPADPVVQPQGPSSGEDGPAPVQPEPMHGMLYLPAAVLHDTARLDAALDKAQALGLDTVLLELKDADGILHYRSQVAQAAEIGAVAEGALPLEQLTERISAAGLRFGVRFYALRDPQAAMYRKDWAVKYQNTDYNWLDNEASLGGKPWLNPYSAEGQAYLLELLAELSQGGAQSFVIGGLQFPNGYLQSATYPGEAAMARSEALRSFAAAIGETVVGELSFTAPIVSVLGGNTELFGGALPQEIFPSLAVTMIPDALPAAVQVGEAQLAVDPAPQALLAQLQGAAGVPLTPYLQAATVQELEQQRQVLEAGGVSAFVLYDPDGVYTLA